MSKSIMETLEDLKTWAVKASLDTTDPDYHAITLVDSEITTTALGTTTILDTFTASVDGSVAIYASLKGYTTNYPAVMTVMDEEGKTLVKFSEGARNNYVVHTASFPVQADKTYTVYFGSSYQLYAVSCDSCYIGGVMYSITEKPKYPLHR